MRVGGLGHTLFPLRPESGWSAEEICRATSVARKAEAN